MGAADVGRHDNEAESPSPDSRGVSGCDINYTPMSRAAYETVVRRTKQSPRVDQGCGIMTCRQRMSMNLIFLINFTMTRRFALQDALQLL